jgi:putative PIN family toxin of toxin-antitoxin system
VWVSAFLNPAGFPARILQAAWEERFDLIVSNPLLEELRDVLSRPRIMRVRGTTWEEGLAFVQGIANVARIVSVSGTMHLCRDPEDDMILEAALAAPATHVVSRDEDLTRDLDLVQTLKKHGVAVMTVSQFLAALEP